MRRIGLSLLVLLLVLVAVEVGSAVLLRAIGTDELAHRLADATRAPVSETSGDPNASQGGVLPWEVLHPYLGYVDRPGAKQLAAGLSVDALGFQNGGPFVTAADPHKMVIGVFGGSVAQFFVEAGGPQRAFEDVAAGREMIVVSTAVGGYKQPQQLLALVYLLSLGMHFDAVLLLDGFNEVALPVAENAKQGTFPFFPREWALRVAALDVATDVRSLVGQIAFRRELRSGIATSFERSPLHHSRFASLVWLLYDRHAAAVIETRRRQLQELRPQSLEYLGTGPPWPNQGDALYRDLAEVWRRSAQQMDAICRANGIRFVHFLQPNQYVPGSKSMSPEELAVAINDSNPYAAEVRRGYPHLQRAGEELRASGAPFHDLVGVFANTPETVYRDDCCHFNQRGNEILAEAMAEQIRHDLASPTGGAVSK